MGVDVSVIITAYNVEHYIARAIHSALSQQGVNIEVLVVDDASTDATWSAIQSITDPRITAIRQPVNGGPGAARNTGLQVAEGDWIAVLDGDDAFEPGRLARCLESVSHATAADMIVDNLLVCREEDGTEFPMFPPDAFEAMHTINATRFIHGRLPSKHNYTLGYLKPLFKRSFLAKHQLAYDTELRIGEDYRIVIEALLLGARCHIANFAGYRYTARRGSISYRLSETDILRMQQADRALMARYTLPADAAREQAARSRMLRRELAYTRLINALKQKNWPAAAKVVFSSPVSLFLLHRPLQVRLKRLFT